MHVPSLVGQSLPKTSNYCFLLNAIFIIIGNILFGIPLGDSPINPDG